VSRVPAIELKRHYRELSAEHATEVAETVADVIVNFIKARSCHNASARRQARPGATPPSRAEVPVGSPGDAAERSR